MESIVKNLIEYTGFSHQIPSLFPPTPFKQFNFSKTIYIPSSIPNISQIMKVVSKILISNSRVIRTPMSTSSEGQVLTGFKLVVHGELRQTIEYIADISSQAVHIAYFTIYFSTFIVLPSDYVIGTPLTLTGYIEDVSVKLLDERSIFENATVLVVAE